MADASITKRELASLYSIWVELDGPVNDRLSPDDIQPKTSVTTVANAISEYIWKDMDTVKQINDVFAFQWQGIEFKKWLKDRNAPTSGWKYGIWEKNITPFSEATNNRAGVTYIMDDIWEKFFDPQHKSLFGKSKKDSWNPADVYISKLSGSEERQVLSDIKQLKDKTLDLQPHIFVALVNEYLRNLYHDNDVIGISLKAATWPNKPKVKGRNYEFDDDFEPPKFGEASLTKPIHQFMSVGSQKKGMGFITNSLKFECDISMGGCDPIDYGWESKSPVERGLPTTEMKDLVGTHKPLKNQLANARTGGIPKPVLASLIKEYTNQNWDDQVPRSVVKSSTSRETLAKVWAKYITDLKSAGNGMVKLDDFKIIKKTGETSESKKLSNSALYKYWVNEVLKIDSMTEKQVQSAYGWKKESKFRANMRNKFIGLRIMRSLVDAKKKGKFGEFLVRCYYAASKMRFSVNELQAPFVKIQ